MEISIEAAEHYMKQIGSYLMEAVTTPDHLKYISQGVILRQYHPGVLHTVHAGHMLVVCC